MKKGIAQMVSLLLILGLAGCANGKPPVSSGRLESQADASHTTVSSEDAAPTTPTVTEGSTNAQETSRAPGGPSSPSSPAKTSSATAGKTTARSTTSAGTTGQPANTSLYNFQEIMYPIWKGGTAYQEAVLPLEGTDGKIVLPLLYKAKEIVKIENAYLTKTYTQGKDYRLNADGTVFVPDTSALPKMEHTMHYPTEKGPLVMETVNGGYERIYNPTELQKWLVVVTYKHDDAYAGPIPERQGDRLSNFKQKVEKGQKTTVVFYGDSITVGGDVSGQYDCSPYMPAYPELVMQALKERYPRNEFVLINNAKGGEDVRWGYNNANGKVVKNKPDLAVVAFGMNSSGLSKAEYKKQTQGIIEKIRNGDQSCDIVLVSGMMPNPALAAYVVPAQDTYGEALSELSQAYERVAVANVKAVQQYVLTKKRFIDINANNINHNNDYFGRWYAQIVLETLLPAK